MCLHHQALYETNNVTEFTSARKLRIKIKNYYNYNAAKIVSDYLQPLAHNDYVVKDTLTFAEIIKTDVLNPKVCII